MRFFRHLPIQHLNKSFVISYPCTGGVYLQQGRQLGAFNGYTKVLEDMAVPNLQLETSIRVADLVGDLADEAVMTYIIPRCKPLHSSLFLCIT